MFELVYRSQVAHVHGTVEAVSLHAVDFEYPRSAHSQSSIASMRFSILSLQLRVRLTRLEPLINIHSYPVCASLGRWRMAQTRIASEPLLRVRPSWRMVVNTQILSPSLTSRLYVCSLVGTKYDGLSFSNPRAVKKSSICWPVGFAYLLIALLHCPPLLSRRSLLIMTGGIDRNRLKPLLGFRVYIWSGSENCFLLRGVRYIERVMSQLDSPGYVKYQRPHSKHPCNAGETTWADYFQRLLPPVLKYP